MARTLTEIRLEITDVYVQQMAAIGVTINTSTWSATSLERLLIYVFAFSAYVLERAFDLLRSDTDTRIKELKPHSQRWYRNKALDFQYGFSLPIDTDTYNNTGYTTDQIANSKVIKYAAVVEQQNNIGRVILRVKLAGVTNGDLAPLSSTVIDAVTDYFSRIKDAGVPIQIDSLPADKIKMKWKVLYDPLVLSSDGARLDGTDNAPVRNAIKNYLKDELQGGQMPFNGTYVMAHHQDYIQLIEGVVVPHIVACSVSYGSLNPATVNILYEPDAGYLRFYQDTDLEIEYESHGAIQ